MKSISDSNYSCIVAYIGWGIGSSPPGYTQEGRLKKKNLKAKLTHNSSAFYFHHVLAILKYISDKILLSSKFLVGLKPKQ